MRSSRTGLTRSHPVRETMVAFRIFLPHHDAKITSGSRRATSEGSTMRSLASAAVASSGKIGAPPAISTSSSTPRMPEMSRSAPLSHPADAGEERLVPFSEEDAAAPRRPRAGVADALEIGGQLRGKAFRAWLTPNQAAQHPDHLQDLGNRSLVEDHHVHAAPDQLGDQIRL